MGTVRMIRPAPKPVPLPPPPTPLYPEDEERGIVASFFCVMADMTPLPQILLVGFVLVTTMLTVRYYDDGPVDNQQSVVRRSIAAWGEQMRADIDGMSCRYSDISECDVHMSDGTREYLRCDGSGCATRDVR